AILWLVTAACNATSEPSAAARSSPRPSPFVGATPTSIAAIPTSTPVATPKPTATPTPKATPEPVPPKPTGVRFREHSKCLDPACGRARVTQAVVWRAPRTRGVEVRVYGVTSCLAAPAHPTPGTGGPCLVEHTALLASVRRLLATAPASAGEVSWSWKVWTGCDDPNTLASPPHGDAYVSIVVAAYNASDHSIFAIAAPGSWYEVES